MLKNKLCCSLAQNPPIKCHLLSDLTFSSSSQRLPRGGMVGMGRASGRSGLCFPKFRESEGRMWNMLRQEATWPREKHRGQTFWKECAVIIIIPPGGWIPRPALLDFRDALGRRMPKGLSQDLSGTEGWARQVWLHLLGQSLTSGKHYTNDDFNCIAMEDKARLLFSG